MATLLSDRIRALIAQANSVTGANDTKLSDAITTLCNGYGSGGGTVVEDLVLYDRLRSDNIAYIDTGLIVNQDQTLRIAFGEIVDKSVFHLFGASSNNEAKKIQWTVSDGKCYATYCSSQQSFSHVLGSGDTIEMGVNKSSSSTWICYFMRNDTTVGQISASPWGYREAERTLLLFCNRVNGGTSINTNRTTCEIRRFTLTNTATGELVADFVPCTYQDVAGMWDLVSETFFGNANTSGAFTAINDD